MRLSSPMTPLPVVVDVPSALRNEVLVHAEPGTNVASRYTIAIGDVTAAFRQAEYTRKETFMVHRHTGNPLETRGLIASYEAGTGELQVWGVTKVPHFNRAILASFLDMPESKIHFIEPDVGGGFGIRGEFYPEDFLIPFAAMKVGQPVKWIEDRREHFKPPITRDRCSATSKLRRSAMARCWACGRTSTATWERIFAPTAAWCRPQPRRCSWGRTAFLPMK